MPCSSLILTPILILAQARRLFVSSRPHGLIVVLRCYLAASAGAISDQASASCTILAHSSATWTLLAYASAKGALLHGDSVRCSVRIVACPIQLSSSAVSTSLLLRWL